jgi:hypothetical protein
MMKTRSRTCENAQSGALRLSKGARRPQVSEPALGALLLAPGAPDRTTFALSRIRVLGASRVGVRGDRFEVFFCCFYLLFYWNNFALFKSYIF